MLTPSVHLYILLFFSTRIIYSQASCSCDLPESNFATGVNLLYYKCNGETPATIAYPITAPEGLLNVLEDKRTIFYVFGYLETPEVKNVQIIMEALCHERTDNVVLLDWSKYSDGTYMTAFQNAEKVGRLFAQSIRLLVNNGLDVSKIYIIGHSLGSHLASFAGKCNEFDIPRITGLDPANPFLYLPGCYLTSKDATWVDVIHTDMGTYGTPISMGTAQYYVNGGTRPQPGCKIIGRPLSEEAFCSHQKSVKLYAKSKYNPNEFIAVQCTTYISYMLNGCKDNLQNGVGYAASNVQGSFYLTTGVL